MDVYKYTKYYSKQSTPWHPQHLASTICCILILVHTCNLLANKIVYSVAHKPLHCTRVVDEVAVVVRYNRKKVLGTTAAAAAAAG